MDYDAKCFVLMPHGENGEYPGGVKESAFNFRTIIQEAVNKAFKSRNRKCKVIREMEKSDSGNISGSIITSLMDCDICIADITGLNPNVFFELGVRLTLHRNKTIIIMKKGTSIPFDVRCFRVLEYDPFEPKESIQKLVNFIISSIDSNINESLVYDSIPDLIVERRTSNRNDLVITLNQYHRRIEEISEAISNTIFRDSIIIGISNGGGIFAELLARELSQHAFDHKTFLRHRVSIIFNKGYQENQFDDSVNSSNIDSIIGVMAEMLRNNESNKIPLLIVDDLLNTRRTANASWDYIMSRISNYNSRFKTELQLKICFLPLYVKKNSKRNTKNQDDLPSNSEGGLRFLWNETEMAPYRGVFTASMTEAEQFSYGKFLSGYTS